MATGTAVVLFPALPDGDSNATLTVTGQGSILSTSLVEAWISYAATSDHSADEHLVEQLRVLAGNIVTGVSFDIVVVYDGLSGVYGGWNVNWVWL